MVAIRSILESICWFGLLVLLFGIPLLYGSYYAYQWSFFATYMFALFSCYTVLLAFGQNYNKRAVIKARPLFLLMLLQVAWLYCQSIDLYWINLGSGDGLLNGIEKPTWLLSRNTISLLPIATTTEIIKSLFYLALLFMLFATLNNKKRLMTLVICLAISGSLHAITGLTAKFLQVHLVELKSLDGHWYEARGLFVNRNHFAAFISLCLACLMVFPVRAILKKKSVSTFRLAAIHFLDVILSFKSIILFLIIICISAILLSTSRAGTLSLLGAVSFWSLCFVYFDRRSRGLKLLLVVIAVLFALAFLWFGAEALLGRITSGALDIGERGQQWIITMSIISDFWLTGTGTGTYEAVFQYYRTDHEGLRQVIFDQAHSEYLQIFLEQGIIGFALWLAYIIYIFRLLVPEYKKQNSTLMKSVIFCSLVGISAALVQALVDFNLQIPAIKCYFYSLLALGIVATQIYKNSTKNNV